MRFSLLLKSQSKRKLKLKQFTKIATSNILKFKDTILDPMQIHLAYTEKQSEMRISWVSGSNSTPCLFYGNSIENLNMNECGKTETYTDSDMCEPIATTDGYIDPGFLHDVVLKNLDSDTEYFYKISGNVNLI